MAASTHRPGGSFGMNRISLALVALLLAASGCETANQSAAPGAGAVPEDRTAPDTGSYEPPAPGTIAVVRHEDGRLETSRVLGSDGFALTMLRDGARVTEVPFCFRCGVPPVEEPGAGAYRALWPLEVGASARFLSRTGDGSVLTHDVRVTGTETVETDFGPVEALVVEETVTGEGGSHSTRTQWFSPRLGWSVRSRWDAPEAGPGGWELAAIALPQ